MGRPSLGAHNTLPQIQPIDTSGKRDLACQYSQFAPSPSFITAVRDKEMTPPCPAKEKALLKKTCRDTNRTNDMDHKN